MLLGIGLGGFVDGILLHQILQWHHMLTSTADYPGDTVAGLEKNTLADGFFHLSTWIFVAIGSTLSTKAWKEGRLAPPWRAHVGMLLVGWGAFNLIEGTIDHEILGIHHVRDDLGGPIGWDLGFLTFGLAMVAVGLAMSRNAERNLFPLEHRGGSQSRPSTPESQSQIVFDPELTVEGLDQTVVGPDWRSWPSQRRRCSRPSRPRNGAGAALPAVNASLLSST